MFNTTGPEFDLARVTYAVLEECEHRRRGFDKDELEFRLTEIARMKLADVKRAYSDAGGPATYWEAVEREVMDTALPQYVDQAASMNALERSGFNVFRSGDVAARFTFALAGLLIGSIIIALPFIPIFEDLFAFALTGAGFIYPDLVRYTYERRHTRVLNRLVDESERYQQNGRLRYMTNEDFGELFETSTPHDSVLPKTEEQPQAPSDDHRQRGGGTVSA